MQSCRSNPNQTSKVALTDIRESDGYPSVVSYSYRGQFQQDPFDEQDQDIIGEDADGLPVFSGLHSATRSCYDELGRKIRRPPNAFMVFSNERRKVLAAFYPGEGNNSISTRLGEEWKQLSEPEKKKYFEEAKRLDIEHKQKYPFYQYCPGEARRKRQSKGGRRKANSEQSSLSKSRSGGRTGDKSGSMPIYTVIPPKRPDQLPTLVLLDKDSDQSVRDYVAHQLRRGQGCEITQNIQQFPLPHDPHCKLATGRTVGMFPPVSQATRPENAGLLEVLNETVGQSSQISRKKNVDCGLHPVTLMKTPPKSMSTPIISSAFFTNSNCNHPVTQFTPILPKPRSHFPTQFYHMTAGGCESVAHRSASITNSPVYAQHHHCSHHRSGHNQQMLSKSAPLKQNSPISPLIYIPVDQQQVTYLGYQSEPSTSINPIVDIEASPQNGFTRIGTDVQWGTSYVEHTCNVQDMSTSSMNMDNLDADDYHSHVGYDYQFLENPSAFGGWPSDEHPIPSTNGREMFSPKLIYTDLTNSGSSSFQEDSHFNSSSSVNLGSLGSDYGFGFQSSFARPLSDIMSPERNNLHSPPLGSIDRQLSETERACLSISYDHLGLINPIEQGSPSQPPLKKRNLRKHSW